MKTNKSFALLALFAAAFSVVGMEVVRAQDIEPELPVSRRLCCCSVTIPGGVLSFLAVGERAPVATGTVASGSSGTTLEADEDLSAYANGHYVKISADGRVVCSIKILDESDNNGSSSLTLASDLPSGLAVGTTFEVVPCQTLAGALGANAFGLTASGSAGTADQVLLTIDGTLTRFFYNPGVPSVIPAQWVQVGQSGNANDTPLDPGSGIAIDRKAGDSKDIEVYGFARCKSHKIDIIPGLGIYTWPFSGADVTLDDSGLQTVLAGSGSAGTADQVLIETGGTIRRYFYNPGVPSVIPAQWVQVGQSGNAGSTVIPKGKAFGIDRTQGGALQLTVDDPLL